MGAESLLNREVFPELSRKAVLRRLLKSDPQEADAMLERLKIQSKDAVSEVRRLVHGLRPPDLDDLGLVSAIR